MHWFVDSQRPPRRRRLEVEPLESRDCPAAPSIMVSVSQLTGQRVRVSGMVIDEHPSGITVNLGGVVSGTTYTVTGGMYLWEGDASSLGNVTASCTDDENLQANTAQATITNNAPTLSMSILYGSGKTVTLMGSVNDETPDGRIITLSGQVNATVVTNSNGTWNWTGPAAGLGTISATTTDPWGATSNTAQSIVASNAPVISNFQAIESPGPARDWIFKGQVADESYYGLTVTLGGTPSLNGEKGTVDSTGWFSILVELDEGEQGTATARTTDWWGLNSNVAEAVFSQTP